MHIVNNVLTDNQTGFHCKSIYPAHIAEDTLADIMDIILFHPGFPGSHGNSGIIKIIDMIMGDIIGTGMEENAYSALKDSNAGMNVIVGDTRYR